MGKKAHFFQEFIPNTHDILITSHTSPFSARRNIGNIPSFIGSNVFKKINDNLHKHNKSIIIW